jgi:membrane peptidoglycan carboxypeptidase
MVDKLSDFKFNGNIYARLSVDTSPPKPKVKITLQNGCRIVKEPSSMSVSNFRKMFTRIVQDVNGKPIEIESGPGSKWWVPLNAIPRYMPKAVMTTEDAGFEHHNGFIIQAIENSIAMDIESGKFTRGGSTISMQLAKNLWLSRTKTISRKLQEFFLTTYLEQSMTKNEIMELYLNIVELGPGVYGIGQAANEYFNKSAASLTLGECLFLASILPAPKQPKFNADGLLYKQWADYLRTLMKLMASKEYISEDELNSGLTEQIKKGGSENESEPPIQLKETGVNPNSWVTDQN